jgi:hypothetical protein
MSSDLAASATAVTRERLAGQMKECFGKVGCFFQRLEWGRGQSKPHVMRDDVSEHCPVDVLFEARVALRGASRDRWKSRHGRQTALLGRTSALMARKHFH